MINWRKPLIFSLLYATGSRIPGYLNEITRVSLLSDDEKKSYQDSKLKQLLLHAHRTVPYYSRVLGEVGVVRDRVVHLERFSEIPLLTKQIIREEGESLFSGDRSRRGCFLNATGGSTGEPMSFMQDKEYFEWDMATRLHYKRACGQDIGHRELRILSSERDLPEGITGPVGRTMKYAKNWLYNRRERSSFRLSPERMEKFVRLWEGFRPSWIEVSSFALFEMARFLQQNEGQAPLKGALSSVGGPLDIEMKRVITARFTGPIYDLYSARDCGVIAYGVDRLAVCFWHNRVEVLGGRTDVRDGKIVITTLNNYSMPLIRYDIGDVCRPSDRPREIGPVAGRVIQYFKKRSGEKILGGVFSRPMHRMNGRCKKFRLVQKDYDRIEVSFVGTLSETDCRVIETNIRDAMGGDCAVMFTSVADIPPTRSGKHLYAVSEVE